MFKKITTLTFTALFFCAPLLVQAGSLVPEPSGGGEGDYTVNDFVRVAVNVSEIILGIVGSLTLLMFIYGGVTLIFSGGNKEAVDRGKKTIIGAVIGLIIVFSSYTIIQFTLKALGFAHKEGTWFTTETK